MIGVKDPKWVERPLALIVLKPEHAGQVDKAEIQRHVKGFADKGLISKYAAPQTVIFVEALAKTRVGKTNKKELREKYQHAAAWTGLILARSQISNRQGLPKKLEPRHARAVQRDRAKHPANAPPDEQIAAGLTSEGRADG